MRVKHTNLYKYNELSDEAKERARDWYRSAGDAAEFQLEHVLDEFPEVAKALGWTLGKARGSNRPAVYYSGFSSQGDGACFEGSWRAKDCNPAALLADRPVSFTNAEGKTEPCKLNASLHKVAAPFIDLAGRFPDATGESTHTGRYYHGHSLGTGFDSNIDRDEETHTHVMWDAIRDEEQTAADEFHEATVSLADYLYRWLETEYEYVNSDEQVAETIISNEYEFTIDGQRA